MKWLKISINTSDIDGMCAALSALGIDGVELEDFDEFTEFLEHNRMYWDYVDDALIEAKRGVSRVIFYLPDTDDGRTTLDAVMAKIGGDMQVLVVDEDDWQDSWQQYYKPTPIGGRLLILPEWEQRPDTDRVIFINNPGMSFGTGTHASTQLALELVERTVRCGDRVLDLGCGSGILAICALLLGAESAVGVDIDPMAADISRENAARNGVVGRYTAYAGDVTGDTSLLAKLKTPPDSMPNGAESEGFDAVYANIVADVIMALAPTARLLLRPRGVFIISGIIDERREEVLCSLAESGFEITEHRERDGWVAALLR